MRYTAPALSLSLIIRLRTSYHVRHLEQIGTISLSYISFVSCLILNGYCIEVTDGGPQKDIHQLNPLSSPEPQRFFKLLNECTADQNIVGSENEDEFTVE